MISFSLTLGISDILLVWNYSMQFLSLVGFDISLFTFGSQVISDSMFLIDSLFSFFVSFTFFIIKFLGQLYFSSELISYLDYKIYFLLLS